ncbi:IclR family transcriptional regulator domain-containing protein [Microcella pacifica]|uniref:IclR family transcriptional regulator domain-containing protein n=1 Tax=Microcella pacifica TaxID=2591847 RepID=UPI0033163A8B
MAQADADSQEGALYGCDLPALTPHTLGSQVELDAERKRIRSSGVARDHEELRAGTSPNSTHVWLGGHVRATPSVTAPVGRLALKVSDYVAALLDCARRPSLVPRRARSRQPAYRG